VSSVDWNHEIISDVIQHEAPPTHEERVLQRNPDPNPSWLVAFAPALLLMGLSPILPRGSLADVSSALAASAVADSSAPALTPHGMRPQPEQKLWPSAASNRGTRFADYVQTQAISTRLFANFVGSKGYVYAVEPTRFFQFEPFRKAVRDLQA